MEPQDAAGEVGREVEASVFSDVVLCQRAARVAGRIPEVFRPVDPLPLFRGPRECVLGFTVDCGPIPCPDAVGPNASVLPIARLPCRYAERSAHHVLDLDGVALHALQDQDRPVAEGDLLPLAFRPEALLFFDAAGRLMEGAPAHV